MAFYVCIPLRYADRKSCCTDAFNSAIAITLRQYGGGGFLKTVIASDLHGSATCCSMLIDRFFKEGAETLLLLGDILYHGPRNDLPEGYEPKAVFAQLNAVKDKIFCVRGNCDAEVDQMVLEFKLNAESILLDFDGLPVRATHGHRKLAELEETMPQGSVLLYGHTHLFEMRSTERGTILNPGSVTLPKGGNPKTYILYEDRAFIIKTLDGLELRSVSLV